MSEVQKVAVLKSLDDQVIRVFTVTQDTMYAVLRADSRRISFCHSLEDLTQQGVEYTVLKSFSSDALYAGGFEIPQVGRVQWQQANDVSLQSMIVRPESSKTWWISVATVSSLAVLVFSFLLNMDITEQALKEELRQHVVKLIQRRPQKKVAVLTGQMFNTRKTSKPVKVKRKSVRRVGALAVLGSLNKGRQKGGINLGQVKVSRGPGLGGSQGSGGVQTSLYGKGIVAAPVGVGGNIKGAGGYGTKGKGGGQAGYGKVSLIGSSGADLIPLGKEAIINGGLDKDLIGSVIRKNMGQIRFCYERGLQTDPRLKGRVAVNFTIGGNGRVKVAGLNNTTLHSKLVEDCILMRLKSWKFPLPEGGADVRVSYPFMLQRNGHG